MASSVHCMGHMAHFITQSCVGTCDTACVTVCPADCIVGPVELARIREVEPQRRGERFPGLQLFIDPEECIDCGACIPECPVDAIMLDHDAGPELRADLERNAAFFR